MADALFAAAIFGRNVVFRYFVGMHFGNIGVRRVFDTFHHLGLERLTLFGQLFYTLKIDAIYL